MQDNDLTEGDIFGELIIYSTVKTKTKSEKMEMIKAQDFFNKLFELEIIIKNDVKQNLASFLCIDQTYINSLMYRKIRKVLADFKTYEGLRAVGICKRKVPEEL